MDVLPLDAPGYDSTRPEWAWGKKWDAAKPPTIGPYSSRNQETNFPPPCVPLVYILVKRHKSYSHTHMAQTLNSGPFRVERVEAFTTIIN